MLDITSSITEAPFFDDVADAPDGTKAYWLTTEDGLRIRIGVFPGGDKGTILLFPGRTEYIEKYGRAAREFAARGYTTVAVDWRGQGLGARLLKDPNAGHVDHFPDYQNDVRAVMAAVKDLNVPKPLYLIGHSMGGCIGLRAVMEGLPVKAATFTAPMWGILVTPAMRPIAWSVSWLARHIGLGGKYTPGTEPVPYVMSAPFADNTLTRDRDMFDHMRSQLSQHPDLSLGGPSMQWLNEALREIVRMSAAPAPDLPTLCILGSNERIVDPERVKKRMEHWTKGELLIMPEAEHEVMMEREEIRNKVFDSATALFDANR
ncbi:alpha/beta hydrolase [Parasulfitobacter algicola]|uniref:Alpha/beta hydrolase n=1 Tax=Parasulfitobacter algicola TaxID=2614809 RepID=A0ABX2ITY9_9RHOB|nr:alpha/beta hydrolase [Sulfitobacter algicola]NSX54292.1 alpha/beta hydrolase [Sulfitobacter algicola]